MLHLSWRAKSGDFGQVIKLTWDRGSPLAVHTHDYPELFWLDEGKCRHLINGDKQYLERGNLVFIRPRDAHQLVSIPGHRFTMTNIELDLSMIDELGRRHPETLGKWFAHKKPFPLQVTLGEYQLGQLQHFAKELAPRRLNRLNMEGFCLDLARSLNPGQTAIRAASGCPDWLQDALLKIHLPENFEKGPSALFRAAGRSPEHVARLCRKFTGKTPTAIVEQARMGHVEHRLRLTPLSITEIALECGYATTAQFYRAFKKHFGKTPQRYRRWVRGE